MGVISEIGKWAAGTFGLVHVDDLHDKIEREVADQMAQTEAEINAEVADLVGMAVAEIGSLRTASTTFAAELATAIQNGDMAKAQALADDQALDIARSAALLEKLRTVYPIPVPDVAEPAPGQPAEVPEGSTVTPVEDGDLDVPEVVLPQDIPGETPGSSDSSGDPAGGMDTNEGDTAGPVTT